MWQTSDCAAGIRQKTNEAMLQTNGWEVVGRRSWFVWQPFPTIKRITVVNKELALNIV